MSKLSFDGFGINGPDKYRTRVATFTNDEAGKAYGKLFEASPDLLAACEAAVKYLEAHRPKGKIREIFSQLNEHENVTLKPLRAAIAQAKGGAL